MKKPILCLDFDGVCHVYTSGWKGANIIPDDAVPGLFDFLEDAAAHFDIQVFSARSNQPGGIEAMQAWFEQQYRKWCSDGAHTKAMPAISFAVQKPAAFVSLDDRALTFTGQWPDLDLLRNFRPWHKDTPHRKKSSSEDS